MCWLHCTSTDHGPVQIRKHYPRKRQEARLYLPCVAATLIPIGIFIYAWTARPEVHWIAPAIGLTVCPTHLLHRCKTDISQDIHVRRICDLHGGLSISRRLVKIFWPVRLNETHQSHSYGTYASSAIAGQSMCREFALSTTLECF